MIKQTLAFNNDGNKKRTTRKNRPTGNTVGCKVSL